jgi:hypothetical protein
MAIVAFLANLRDHGELDLAGLDVKHSVGGIPLGKDSMFLLEKHRFSALADGCEECMRIEVAPLVGSHIWKSDLTLRLECRGR